MKSHLLRYPNRASLPRAGEVLIRLAAAVGLCGTSSHGAAAAPFCVRTQAIPAQCLFFDAAQCEKRAREMGGICEANIKETPVGINVGHYCLVTSAKASLCIYLDYASCEVEARHQQGVCVEAPNRPESPAADPYRDIRPSMAGH